jgi:hypothetical protein
MADKVAFIKGTGAKGTRKCLAVSGAVWVYFMFSRHVELKLREIRAIARSLSTRISSQSWPVHQITPRSRGDLPMAVRSWARSGGRRHIFS